MKNAWVYIIIGAIAMLILLAARDMWLWNKIGRESLEKEKRENKGRYNIIDLGANGKVFMKNGKYYWDMPVQCITAPCPPVVEEITQAKYASLAEGSIITI